MYIISVTVAELCICGVIYDQATNNNQADQTHHTHVFGDPNSGIFLRFSFVIKSPFLTIHPPPFLKIIVCNLKLLPPPSQMKMKVLIYPVYLSIGTHVTLKV